MKRRALPSGFISNTGPDAVSSPGRLKLAPNIPTASRLTQQEADMRASVAGTFRVRVLHRRESEGHYERPLPHLETALVFYPAARQPVPDERSRAFFRARELQSPVVSAVHLRVGGSQETTRGTVRRRAVLGNVRRKGQQPGWAPMKRPHRRTGVARESRSASRYQKDNRYEGTDRRPPHGLV
jgi:hypothetical protein